ncbi:MAG: N-methyl-L-tryptophan oxidase [Gemmataceae bacterium]
MTRADVIVVGLGGMGTAAAWQLARRGASVVGLEQFALGHDRGSSHGHTRITRQAYYEHPAYVPLVRRAFEGWYDLEQARGVPLLLSSPCLTLGRPEGELVAGVRRSAAEHRLSIEELSAQEVHRRYPAFRLDDAPDLVGVIEHTAGILLVDACVRALADEARHLGARLRENEPVVAWRREGGTLVVETPRDRYEADRLVLTAGPWMGALLGRVGIPLRVMRQVALWLQPSDPVLFRRDRFPVYIAETPGGSFYGFPALDRRGAKVARHYGAEERPGPDGVDRTVTAADEAPVRTFVRAYLPSADGLRLDGSVCLYTLTPDRHFLIDHHPDAAGVVLAGGFSGHGFKFAPVVGEILADLALTGATRWPIDLVAAARPTLAVAGRPE